MFKNAMMLGCLFLAQSSFAQAVFQAGDGGYKCFRIPAIVKAKSGNLLAFAEARKNSCSDTDNIDLVVKSSKDNGTTWSDLSVVWDDQDNTCGNPAPIVDAKTGAVVLVATWNLGGDHEKDIIAGTSKDTRRVYVLRSTDEGKSWSAPKEITKDTKKENWAWYATGPGNGIQIKKGAHKNRMVVACDYVEVKTNKGYSHVIYSDDAGITWTLGGIAPKEGVNESTVAEAGKGELLLNMRNYNREKLRKVARSTDGGATWVDFKSDPALEEPVCQGSLISLSKGMAFANPASQTKREKMTIKLSFDKGHTWTKSHLVHAGPSAYSNLVELNKKEIGILYEGGEKSPYEKIVFKKVSKKDFK